MAHVATVLGVTVLCAVRKKQILCLFSVINVKRKRSKEAPRSLCFIMKDLTGHVTCRVIFMFATSDTAKPHAVN